MLKNIISKFRGRNARRGYTLMELMTVVGIIAVVVAIAIPSVIAINRSLKFKQRNDYAKTVFIAAQTNLTDMRSSGQLSALAALGDEQGQHRIIDDPNANFPTDQTWSGEYRYTTSDELASTAYSLVLPAGSVDSALRDKNILIEYNPYNGNVYSVFYSEEGSILTYETVGALRGDSDEAVKERKKLFLGYYEGTGLGTSKLDISEDAAKLRIEDGEECIAIVEVPVPETYLASARSFMSGLIVELTIDRDPESPFGESLGSDVITLGVKKADSLDNCELDKDGRTVRISYVLDSLIDGGSFGNQALKEKEPVSKALLSASQAPAKALSEIKNEDEFVLYPGEELHIVANIDFDSGDSAGIIISGDEAYGVNPMFGDLREDGALIIRNGRHLQNLNALAPTVAAKVTSVVFEDDVNWNDTVTYYNKKYAGSARKTYSNSLSEAPVRQLPYFVPISSEALFGIADFRYPLETGSQSFWNRLLNAIPVAADFVVRGFTGGAYTLQLDKNVPTLTDEMDIVTVDGTAQPNRSHATVQGGGHKVSYLNIDTTLYPVGNPQGGQYYAGANIKDNTLDIDTNRDRFTGLFSYVNTTVQDLFIVNPVIKGYNIRSVSTTLKNNPCTGALVGCAGYNSYIQNCGVYIDTTDPLFTRSMLTQDYYDASRPQEWYGVSGEGAVGGLIGYAKSHRTVGASELTAGDTNQLAFYKCFAAVNVSGNMSESSSAKLGYSNGVGGLVGNAQLTNFFSCYSSGDVQARGVYVSNNTLAWLSGREEGFGTFHDGQSSWGTGGFVGTSHGCRYTNCFSTSDVYGDNEGTLDIGVGGFVGIMCYDENLAFGNISRNRDFSKTTFSQHTVFNSCYAVGKVKNYSGYIESFSGASAKVDDRLSDISGMAQPNYYAFAAAYRLSKGSYPDYYTEGYIYKDSFFLGRHNNGDFEKASKVCASVATADTLANLHTIGTSPTYAQSYVDNELKSLVIYTTKALNGQTNSEECVDFLRGALSSVWGTYGDKAKQYCRNKFSTSALNIRTEMMTMDAFYNLAPSLTNSNELPSEVKKGFSNLYWEGTDAAHTHAYDPTRVGLSYPYSKLVGMDYYGDWPGETSSCVLGYYEVYMDDNGEMTYGVYIDNDKDIGESASSQLRRDLHDYDENGNIVNTYRIVTAGYTVLTSGSTIQNVFGANRKVTVKLSQSNGSVTHTMQLTPLTYSYVEQTTNIFGRVKEETKTVPITYTLPDQTLTYYMYPIDLKIGLDPNYKPGDDFYTRVDMHVEKEINILGETDDTGDFVAFFNPRVALSQVNYVDNLDMENAPPEIYIRYYKQLYSLQKMNPKFWESDGNTKYTFIQMIDIDFTDAEGDFNGDITIGSAEHPFNASYTGSGGYAEKAQIIGLKTKSGLFGSIGKEGYVGDIELVDPLLDGSVSMPNRGILSPENSGRIEGVSITFTPEVKNVSVKASQNAGILVGLNKKGGVVDFCDVESKFGTITLSGMNTGFIGKLIGDEDDGGMTMSDISVNVKNLALNGSAASGGLVGSSEDAYISDCTVSVKSLTGSVGKLVGGAIGSAYNSTANDCTVNLSGECSAQAAGSTFAGFAASASNSLFRYDTVNINEGASVKAPSAAGVFGTGDYCTIGYVNANIGGNIMANNGNAAGFALKLGEGSVIGSEIRLLNFAYIKSSTAKAAGFTVETDSELSNVSFFIGDNKTGSAAVSSGTVSGVSEAAGIACVATGTINNCFVSGSGTIKATGSGSRAAGFAISTGSEGSISNSYVSPAIHDTRNMPAAYNGNSNENLQISATGSAASFIVDNYADIVNCKGLGSISAPSCAGFILTNRGPISRSMANASSAGKAFIGTNNGNVQNCYAWYDSGKGASADDASVGSGVYYGCYFADLRQSGSDVKATVYPARNKSLEDGGVTGNGKTGIYTILSTVKASMLNTPGAAPWQDNIDQSYNLCPYTPPVPNNYFYPMLGDHLGDWVPARIYSFGVLYYEQHDDESVNVMLYDASSAAINREQGTYFADSIDKGNSKPIVKSGYLFFAHTQDQLTVFSGSSNVTGMIAPADTNLTSHIDMGTLSGRDAGAATRFNSDGYYYFALPDGVEPTRLKGQNSPDVTIEPFARAIAHQSGEPYEVRTADQFTNISGGYLSESFVQTHDVALGSTTLTAPFTGSYSGKNNGITLTVSSAPAFADINGGSLSDLRMAGNATAIGKLTGAAVANVKFDNTPASGYVITETAKNSALSGSGLTVSCTVPAFKTLDATTVSGYRFTGAKEIAAELVNRSELNGITAANTVTPLGTVSGSTLTNVSFIGKPTSGNAVTDTMSSSTVSGGKIDCTVPAFNSVSGSTIRNVAFTSYNDKCDSYTIADTFTGSVLTNSSTGSVINVRKAAFGRITDGSTVENYGFAHSGDAGAPLLAGTIKNSDISNVSVTLTGGTSTAPLLTAAPEKSNFNAVSVSGKVSNSAAADGQYLGLAVNEATSGAFVDCSADGSITAQNKTGVGGFAGLIGNADFSGTQANVAVSAAISGAGSSAGGFAGRVEGGTIDACGASGSVSSGAQNVGGFAGSMTGTVTVANLSDVSATVTANSGSENAGGFAGMINGSAINMSEIAVSGSVTAAAKNAGGFAGYITGNDSVTYGSYNGTVTASSGCQNLGGFVGVSQACAYTGCTSEGSVVGTVSGVSNVGGFGGALIGAGGYSGSAAYSSVSSSAENVGGFAGSITGGAWFRELSAENDVTTQSGAKNVGGFVGSMTGGVCENISVNGSVTSAAANIGGFAGTNSSTLTAGEIISTIRYTGSGSAAIGGIIGSNNGGAVGTAETSLSAGGSITKTGSVTNVAVGGAIGRSVDGSYINVSTGSEVSAGFAGSNGDIYACPSGLGSVGKFVGDIKSGSFSNCAGNGASDAAYQFLGTILYSTTNAPTSAYKSLNYYDNPIGKRETDDESSFDVYTNRELGETDGTLEKVNGDTIHSYSIQLEDCTFDNGTKTQYYAPEMYYYNKKGNAEKQDFYTFTEKSSMENGSTYLIADGSGTTFLRGTTSGAVHVCDASELEVNVNAKYVKAAYDALNSGRYLWKLDGSKVMNLNGEQLACNVNGSRYITTKSPALYSTDLRFVENGIYVYERTGLGTRLIPYVYHYYSLAPGESNAFVSDGLSSRDDSTHYTLIFYKIGTAQYWDQAFEHMINPDGSDCSFICTYY